MAVPLLAVLADLQDIMPVRPISLRTGISQYRLKQYFSGSVSPAQSTINKLNSYYRSVQYYRLRSGGLSPRQAKRWWSTRNTQVEFIIERLNSIAHEIASAKGKPDNLDMINAIKDGFSASDEAPEQLFEDYPKGYSKK